MQKRPHANAAVEQQKARLICLPLCAQLRQQDQKGASLRAEKRADKYLRVKLELLASLAVGELYKTRLYPPKQNNPGLK